jgi:chromosome segregation ATPase
VYKINKKRETKMANISEQELLELQKQTVQDTLSIAKVYIDQQDGAVKSDLEAQLTTLSNSVTAKFEALDNIDESTLETLVNIKTTLEASGDLTQLLNGYADLDSQLEDILSRLSTAESKISAVETLSNNNKSANEANTTAINALKGRATTLEGEVATLNGDDTVEGSVAKQIKDATGGDISDLAGRVEAEETESTRVKGIIDDTVDGEGNVVSKGLTSKVADLEAELPLSEARAKAYADDKFLSGEMIQNIKLNHRCEIKNVANTVFGFALENCDGGAGQGDGGEI